jgi:hypothetical protein
MVEAAEHHDNEILDMASLLGSTRAGPRAGDMRLPASDPEDDRNGARGQSYVRLPGSHVGMYWRKAAVGFTGS